MPSPKQTTVVLNEKAQSIKDELAPIFGLKNILSAGLLLFSRLSDTEQKKIIAEVNAKSAKEPESHPANLRDALKEIVRKTKEQRGTSSEIIKIPLSDQKFWDELEALLGTKKKPVQKPKTG